MWQILQKRNFSLEEDENVGRPVIFVTEENVGDVRKIFDKDRRVRHPHIEITFDLNAPEIRSTLTDHLHETNFVASEYQKARLTIRRLNEIIVGNAEIVWLGIISN